MSKTVRRKNAELPWIEAYDYEWGPYGILVQTYYEGDELKKIKARYHSDVYDCGWITGATPKWYRKLLTRSRRSKDKEVLHRINQGLYEDYLFNSWKQDAGYDYW